MARLDALRLAEALKRRLVDFSVSDNFVRQARGAEICREIWLGPPSQGGLCSDLWVEGSVPSLSSGKTLPQVVEEGLLTPWLAGLLERNGVFPSTRELYWHQHEALARCRAGSEGQPAVILSAGTGAGKTEAFLLPILQALAPTPRLPRAGCRAINLYPMNALVNDQVERLYHWLRGQDRLSLCHFTSETPEDWAQAERTRFPRFEACRHRTRQRARGLETARGEAVRDYERRLDPPDILITNYSMLEYMLCRPQDQVFFGRGLRAVVLDEAHLYTGTLAAEMTLLLRRLYDKCGLRAEDVLQFAASATLGTGSAEELQDFAATLFGKPAREVVVIQGKPAESFLPSLRPPSEPAPPARLLQVPFEGSTLVMDQDGQEALVESAQACDQLVPLLSLLVAREAVDEARRGCHDAPARLLRVLGRAPEVHRLEEILRATRHIALSELTAQVWGRGGPQEEQATALLLSLASAAREALDDIPLLPHRLHLLLRPSEGVSVCLNERCHGPVERRWPGAGAVWAGREESCPACGHLTLSLYRCISCGESLVAAVWDGRLRPPFPFETRELQFYSLERSPEGCSTVLDTRRGHPRECWRQERCPNCTAPLDDYAPLASSTNLVLSILAETLFAELPPLACRWQESHRILPARGRRMLAFSDSRAEAARLGPRLRRQHDTQLIRSAIVRLFQEEPEASPEVLEHYRRRIRQLEAELSTPGLPPAIRRDTERDLAKKREDLRALLAGGSIPLWAAHLAADPALDELLEEDLGEKHQASSYSDKTWLENSRAIRDQAAAFLGLEMATLPRRHWITAETIGTAEVVYPGLEELAPPGELLGVLPSEAVREKLRGCWVDLVASLGDELRKANAVTLGSREQDQQFQQNRLVIGRWMTLTDFRGATEKGLRRQYLQNVLLEAGCDQIAATTLAPEVLAAVFRQLRERAQASDGERRTAGPGSFPWAECALQHRRGRAPEDGLRVVFPHLALRKPHRLYLCRRTGHVWPRSVLGCAPEAGRRGTLEPATREEVDATPLVGRARREYSAESALFRIGLWAEEHSAQLSPREARRLQELFRRGMRNLLSATTTLELGIDIGGLSAAFLSNVPPGKANYLQRAGRVGRRADGSSVVVTCARSRPYDREVFQNVGKFLGSPLRQPRVFLERERIARRHFHAWLMGGFFEQLYAPERHSVGAMNAFGHMGTFCGEALPPKWEAGVSTRPRLLKSRPERDYERPEWWDDAAGDGLAEQYVRWVCHARTRAVGARLDALFRGTSFEEPDRRAGLFDDARALFERAVSAWRKDYQSLLKAWKSSQDPRPANALWYQLKTLHGVTVIEALANARYLPRYGFPIGVHKLRVVTEDDQRRGRIRVEDQYRLERTSLLALREYVPGSQLLVGGKLVTSRGLLKHWTGANLDEAFGLRGSATTCPNQHFYYWYGKKPEGCPLCGEGPGGALQRLLFPKHGFTTAAWDPPKRSADTERVGAIQTATVAFATRESHAGATLEEDGFAGVPGLSAVYKEEAEILVRNAGDYEYGFAICTGCGYAESERQPQARGPSSRAFEDHAPLQSPSDRFSCQQVHRERTVLRNIVLGAAEPTDVLMLDLSEHLVGRADAETVAQSVAVGLHLAGARLLQLDSRELGHMVVPAGPSGISWGAVVFDNVPGGAGHVLELMKNGRVWLETTCDLLQGSPEHHQRCQQACLDCLMTFDVQTSFSDAASTLDRRIALDFLRKLLGGPAEVEPESWPGEPAPEGGGVPVLAFADLGRGEEAPRAWRRLSGELSGDLFLARLETDSVERQVKNGTWCLFRRNVPGRDLPRDGQVVLLRDPDKPDPEFGAVAVRRLKHAPVTRPDGEIRQVMVKLVPDTRDPRYRRWSFELRPEEWAAWTPFAVLVEPLEG